MADETALLHVEGDDAGGMDMLSALSEMVQSLNESLQGLADTMNSLSGLDEIFAGLASTLGEVNAQFDALDAAVGDLSSAASSAATDLDAVGAAVQQVGASEADLAASVSEASSALAEETGSAAAAAASLAENASANQESAAAAQENAAAQTEAKDAAAEGSSVFSDAAMGMGMLGIAAGMAAKSFIDMGMQAQDSFTTLIALTGASAQDANSYMSGLTSMAQQLGVTMTQASQGMYFVASAGYTGAAGMGVLRYAMMAAKAGGVDMMVVSDALTSVMRGYGASANQASKYTDMLLEATIQGKQTFQDLASAIGPAAVTGKAAGFSFQDVAGAEALMTQSGLDAHRAVMNLNFLMRAVGINAATVASSAKKMGLEFNASTFNADDLNQRLQYLMQITHGNTAEFEKLVGGANGFMAASILAQNGGKNFAAMIAAMGHSAGATAAAFNASENTISAHLAHIKASFSVIAFGLVQAITPIVSPLLAHAGAMLGNFAEMITHHIGTALPILAALGTLVGGTLVVGLGALAVALLAPIAPILGIVAAIAALMGGIVFLVQHWHQMTSALSTFATTGPLSGFFSVLRDLGAYLGGIFQQIWQSLVDLWQNTLLPAWDELKTAVEPLLPVLKDLAMAIGVALVVDLGLLVGALKGTASVFGAFVSTVAQVIGDIVHIFVGVVQVVSGVLRLLYDIITGNWKHIGSDLSTILHGILNIFSGIFEGIWHIVTGGLGMVKAFIWGFIGGVIGFFQHLFDMLVGHSIVPDLIAGIVKLFFGLPVKILGMLAGFVGAVIGQFAHLALAGLQQVGKLVTGFLGGLTHLASEGLHSITSFVGGAFQQLGTWVHNGISQAGSFVHGLLSSLNPMPAQVTRMIQLTKDNTQLHMEEMKLNSINAMVQQKEGVLTALQDQVDGIVRDMETTKSQSVRHADEMKLQVVQKMEEQAQQSLQASQKMQSNVTNQVTIMKNRVHSEIAALSSNTGSQLLALASNAFSWGSHLVSNFTSGIQNMAGAAINAARNLASGIASFLHFTKPDEGPLASVDEWMPHFGDLLKQGLQDQVGKLRGASFNVAAQIAQAAPSSASLSTYNNANTFLSANANNGPVVQVLMQIAALLQQQNAQQQQAQRANIGGAPLNANLPAVNQYNTFQLGGGATSLQQLYQQLNVLAGRSNEYGARGAPSGLS